MNTTFTTCAEKKAKQFLNLLQGYTKGIRMTAILVLLLMGVSNAWAEDYWYLQNNPSHIYFCDATTNWAPNSSDHIIFLMGRDYTYGGQEVGSQAYDMKYLPNTKLWYCNVPKWGDGNEGRYQYIAFRHATSAWTDWKSETVTHRATWENSKYSMTRNDDISGKTLYYEPQSSTTNTNTNVTGYLPNYTATVDFKVSRDGGSSYNVTNKKFGTITLKGTYMNGNNDTEQSSATITGENNYNYNNIPVTGEFTLTNTALTNDAYEFVGFGTGNTPTDKVNTKTWNVTGNTTYYVFYKHKLYTVTYSKGTYGSGSNQTANKLHGETLALADKGAFTRTGYTQTAWNTNTDGKSGTSYALKANYTSNQAITLYPTWTANQSTITWNANGGSVTPASSTYTYDGESVALPTPTRTGYTFNGWFTASSGGSKISDVGNTNKPASNTTYHAQWTENTYTVNIVANPAEAAKTLTSGPKQVGINAVNITTTTNIGYRFKNWTATDGITITTPNSASTTIKATKAGTVTANFEAQPATTIYLEPTGHWNPNNPQYVAHVWVWNTSVYEDIIMEDVGEAPYKYYKAEVPYGYTNVVFYRKSTEGTTIWNQTADLTIPANNNTLYVITDNTTSSATGTWKAANLFYTITLGYCEFGQYGIKYDGKTYYSTPKNNVTINVPAGAQIEIPEGQPNNDEYIGNVVQIHPTGERLTIGQTLTVNSDITLDDNFVTKDNHIVYLGIPNSLTAWEENGKANPNDETIYDFTYHIYRNDRLSSYMDADDQGDYIFEYNGIRYYKFNVKKGCYNIQFQRKIKDAWNGGATWSTTPWLTYQIPLTEVNCFTLKNETDDAGQYKGTWGILPAQDGDYRLLYVEQTVRKSNVSGNEWKTVVARNYEHNSDIVRKQTTAGIYQDTVSLHVRRMMKNGDTDHNPEVILQRYDGSNWVDIEAHMVNGPLKADAGMAMINGRRNAGNNSNIDDFVYDDGIEVIKNDTEKGRVWNFKIQQTVDEEGEVTATLLLDEKNLKPYEGRYYIRTNNTEGGWSQYTHVDNYMTFSQYAKDNSGFSHYYCKWINISTAHPNVKFMVANDYATNLAKECAQDDYTLEDGVLFEDANVRWSWDVVTNKISRAYIRGAYDGNGKRLNNIVLDYTPDGQTNVKDTLNDSGDWIYQVDVTDVEPGDILTSLTATYPSEPSGEQEYEYDGTKADGTKYKAGDSYTVEPTTQIFAENINMLTGDAEGKTYTVRVLYDFKIDKTLVALVPNEHEADIEIDVIIERVDQGEATQVQAGIQSTKTVDEQQGSTVYAVMSFTKDHITSTGESAGNTEWERLYYWVSFPFDVRISDVFGFGEYGVHWIMEYYDGAERAEKGCWADSPTYWRFITDTTYNSANQYNDLNHGLLHANQGYVLALTQDIADLGIFTNTEKVSLYFPSVEPIPNINDGIIQTEVELAKYTCTIERNNRKFKDSNWHMLGVPSYANKTKTLTQDDLLYYYQYDATDNTYDVTSAKDEEVTFKSMHSYFVQFAGTINWQEFSFAAPGQLAARRYAASEPKEHSLRLELQQNGTKLDQTYVSLQEDGATTAFDMNLDLTKMLNAGTNVYTLIPTEGGDVEVAGNVLPVESAVVPLGVVAATAGEYTFAMPDGTDGIIVELIDYETNTRTNLLLSDYTVNLPAGTNDTRFALHVQPSKVATDMENISDETTGLKKYIIDGQLFLQKEGMLYDAQGHIVR